MEKDYSEFEILKQYFHIQTLYLLSKLQVFLTTNESMYTKRIANILFHNKQGRQLYEALENSVSMKLT